MRRCANLFQYIKIAVRQPLPFHICHLSVPPNPNPYPQTLNMSDQNTVLVSFSSSVCGEEFSLTHVSPSTMVCWDKSQFFGTLVNFLTVPTHVHVARA